MCFGFGALKIRDGIQTPLKVICKASRGPQLFRTSNFYFAGRPIVGGEITLSPTLISEIRESDPRPEPVLSKNCPRVAIQIGTLGH